MNPLPEFRDDLRVLEPPDPLLIYYWVGGILLTLLLGLVLFAVIRRLRRGLQERAVEVAARAAEEDALAELEKLFALVKEEQGRTYAIESSAIVRRYIER